MPKNIFVLDPVPTNRIRLTAILEEAHYQVTSAETITGLAGLGADPDVVILGLPSKSPKRALDEVTSLNFPEQTPILCIDNQITPLRRLISMKAGAREILPKEAPDDLVRARIRALIREGDIYRECERRRITAASFGFSEANQDFRSQAKIAYVECEPRVGILPDLISSSVPHQFVRMHVDDVLRDEASVSSPDVYLLSIGSACQTLDSLVPELRDRSHLRHAPVLAIYSENRFDHATRALSFGAADIICETSSGEEFEIRIERMMKRLRLQDALRKADEQSYRLAATDPLTGLYNRRYAEAYLGDLIVRQSDSAKPFVLMIVDLDHFKAVNDTYGHAAGDKVLCEVANRMQDNLRACDLISRLGGEEFLVVLPEADKDVAAQTAERLRHALSSSPVKLEDGRRVPITASIGVALPTVLKQDVAAVCRTGTTDMFHTPAPLTSFSWLVEAADAALYRAKDNGRNRVEFSVSSET